jgi:hypothetical protein
MSIHAMLGRIGEDTCLVFLLNQQVAKAELRTESHQ